MVRTPKHGFTSVLRRVISQRRIERSEVILPIDPDWATFGRLLLRKFHELIYCLAPYVRVLMTTYLPWFELENLSHLGLEISIPIEEISTYTRK